MNTHPAPTRSVRLTALAFATVAIGSCLLVAQPHTSSTVDAATGAWELNVAKSRFNPGPGPKSETRTYAMMPDGSQRAVHTSVDADGTQRTSDSTFTFDGKYVPIKGAPDSDEQAITRTGPLTIQATAKYKGKVVRTITRTISADGKTLTMTFKGTNAKGQPLNDTWVFDRKPDPWLGTWQLNTAKTHLNPGPAPRSETRTYTAQADGSEKATYDTVEANGKRSYAESTYKFDGQPVALVGNPNGEMQSIKRGGPRYTIGEGIKDTKVFRTSTRTVSEDGKTLTLEFKGTRDGKPIIEEKWVFDRVPDSSKAPPAK